MPLYFYNFIDQFRDDENHENDNKRARRGLDPGRFRTGGGRSPAFISASVCYSTGNCFFFYIAR